MSQKEPIQKRKVSIDFDEQIDRHWLNGDAILSRYFDSFSIAFPEAERMMIDTVRDMGSELSDETLKSEAKAFIFQEAQHSLVHANYNQYIRKQGVDLNPLEAFISRWLRWARMNMSLKTRCGMGAGIEHFTTLIAEHFIASGVLQKGDPKMRALWEWHALEELEHRSVLFDVYTKGASGGYIRRILIFIVGLVFVHHMSMKCTYAMLQADGYTKNWSLRFKVWKSLFGRQGILRPLARPFLHYFKPSYHPTQVPVPQIMHDWAKAYNEKGDALEASLYVHQEAV